jgi:HSP90 family molecular chaperone
MRIRSKRDGETVRIKDSRVGMTRLEPMNNLGRIMLSRTRKLIKALGGGGGHRRQKPHWAVWGRVLLCLPGC